MSGNNEWLEYNLKPLLNSVISTLGDVKVLLQTMTATAGTILTQASVSLTGASQLVVSYTNNSGSKQFVSAVIGTTKQTGIWELVLPEGAGTKSIFKRASHQAPNFVEQFIPGFPLLDGKTVELKITASTGSGTAEGFIIAYKTS